MKTLPVDFRGSVVLMFTAGILCLPVAHALLTLTPSVTETTRDLGENILIICETETPDSPHWFGPDGSQILSDAEVGLTARVFAAEQTTFSRLFVNRAEEGDAGVYVCRTDSEQATLELILQLPLRIDSAPSPQETGVGTDYTIYCQVTSPTTPVFTWYYRGDVIDIEATPRYTLAADGLMITDVVTSDAGPYTCEAVNPDTGDSAFKDIVFNVIEDESTPQVLDNSPSSPQPDVTPARTSDVTPSGTVTLPNTNTTTGDGERSGGTGTDNTSLVVGGALAGLVLLMAVIVSLYIVCRNMVKRREGRGRVNTVHKTEEK